MKIFHYIIVLFAFAFVIGDCDEQADKQGHPALSDDYLGIFKNMPLLYEYILATLTKNPEVLEYSHQSYSDGNIWNSIYSRNEETVNNDDESIDNGDSDKKINKRDVDNGQPDNLHHNLNEFSLSDDCVTENYDSNRNICDEKSKPIPYLNGNPIQKTNNEEISNEERATENIDYERNVKRNIDDVLTRAKESSNIRYFSVDSADNIDPKEIQERAIWAEEQLEKHNESRR